MNRFIFFLFFLFTQKAIANDCFHQARSFGGLNRIDESCFWSYHQENSHQNHLHVKFQDFKVWGFANTIWIHQAKRGLLPIAGENTRLHHIIALASSQTEAEIAVLQMNEEQQKEILIFNLQFPGHVKPRRLIQSPRLQTATSLTMDNARDKILVLLKSGQVFEFQLQADDRSVHSTNRANWKKINFSRSHRIVDLAATTDAIMTLTLENQLCAYTIAHQKLQECINIDETQGPLKQIRYYHQDRLLELSNEQEHHQFLLAD